MKKLEHEPGSVAESDYHHSRPSNIFEKHFHCLLIVAKPLTTMTGNEGVHDNMHTSTYKLLPLRKWKLKPV